MTCSRRGQNWEQRTEGGLSPREGERAKARGARSRCSCAYTLRNKIIRYFRTAERNQERHSRWEAKPGNGVFATTDVSSTSPSQARSIENKRTASAIEFREVRTNRDLGVTRFERTRCCESAGRIVRGRKGNENCCSPIPKSQSYTIRDWLGERRSDGGRAKRNQRARLPEDKQKTGRTQERASGE